MHTLKTKKTAITLGLALALALPGLAGATDLVNFKTVFNTDFTSAGYGGMRGLGTGTIALSGVSGTVTEAYLFWQGPNNSADNNNNANVTFAGTNVTGTFLGVSSDNCWGFANSLAYRANVTSLVSGDGNYSLANFIHNDVTGANSDINGASLIVFFNDGNSTNNRDVVMFNGNDSNIDNTFDASGWNITLAGINYSSGTASAQFHVGDGQTFPDSPVLANGTDISTATSPGGAVFNGNTTPGGAGGPANGFLWDIRNFDVTPLLVGGPNTLNITSGVTSDCLSCVMIAIDLPAGAAPPPPPLPEPATLALLGIGLGGLGVMRRKQRA